ncbi:hypothetical protein D3C85_974740 [compost metagenome]
MLGRDGDRLAEAQGVGFADAAAALAAFGLVGQQDDRLVHLAQAFGEDAVQRRHALAGVHHEHDHFGVVERGLGLLAHTRFQAVVGDVFVAGRVDQRQIHVADIAVGIATVTGHARAIIDKRQTLADESVEQCRLAHVGPADDGDF